MHHPRCRHHHRFDTRSLSFWTTVALGLSATLWFLVRVVPKPSRATYPCQRAAAATMGGFLVWLLGLSGFATILRSLGRQKRESRWSVALLCGLVLAAGTVWMLAAQPVSEAKAYTTWTPSEGPNAPMGTARGINPGRVVWAFDPQATRWDGSTGHWWDPTSADQVRVDAMLSQALQTLTSKSSDAEAWTALFTSFNQARGRGNGGYVVGEKLAIKINQNTARGGHAQNGLTNGDQNPINGDPHVILSLLRQLVNQGGVAQNDITVYDCSRYIADSIYVPCHAEFANVHFMELSSGGGDGRETCPKTGWTANALTFAGNGTGRDLPPVVSTASYLINLASMKAHGDDAGPTLHAKNHYGTVQGLNHTWPNEPNSYSYFVELMGSKYLGENTFLFMIDALYGANGADASPSRWSIYPMSGGWPSSLFVSQDGVASESVGWDFINAQWGVPAGCDNTLHEAAQANAPPSGTLYAPNGGGVRLPSLGTHEHWNNATEKKYSRNLGNGSGIELVQLIAADAPIPVPRTGWVASASNTGGTDTADKAIDGASGTRWTSGTAQAVGQWFQVDLGTARTFTKLAFDAGGGTDYPAGFEVLVSDDGINWGAAVATGTATAAKVSLTLSSQTGRYVRIRLTSAGTKWWSIYEFNLYGQTGSVTAPGTGGSTGVGGAASAAGASGGTIGAGAATATGGVGAVVGSAGAALTSSPNELGGAANTNAALGGVQHTSQVATGRAGAGPAASSGAANGTLAGTSGKGNGSIDHASNGGAPSGCSCRVVRRDPYSSFGALVLLLFCAAQRRRSRRASAD